MRTINSSLRQSSPEQLARRGGALVRSKADLKRVCRRRFRAQAKQLLLREDPFVAYELELEAQRAQRDEERWEQAHVACPSTDLAEPHLVRVTTARGLVLANVADSRHAA